MCNQGPPPPFLLRPPGKLNMSPATNVRTAIQGKQFMLEASKQRFGTSASSFQYNYSSFWKSFKWTRENTAVGLGYDPWPYTDHPV